MQVICPLLGTKRTPLSPYHPKSIKNINPITPANSPPSIPSVTALRVLSIIVEKRRDNSGMILHFLREGYDIILLQELNTLPLLPHQFIVGLDKAKIFGNVVNNRHGSAVVFGPRIADYVTPPHSSSRP